MEFMRPRWKGKGFAAIAEANPMSQAVSQLQSSLAHQRASATLSGDSVLLQTDPDTAHLLDCACFGRQMAIYGSDEDCWFQLGLEDAFYLAHGLQCMNVLDKEERPMSLVELWEAIKFKRETFPELYKAYAHLRAKNWVVRPGAQYGVDFLAYRHHPALVHSEYAVLVHSERDGGGCSGARLGVWSDWHCCLRVCGSVAKALLWIYIKHNGCDTTLPSCLEKFSVEERMVARWVPEQCRDG